MSQPVGLDLMLSSLGAPTKTLGAPALGDCGESSGLAGSSSPSLTGFGLILRASRSPDGVRKREPIDLEPDLLHQAARHLAQLAPLTPPVQLAAIGSEPPQGPVRPPSPLSVEDLWPLLVRKAAWSGDARRGSVRLELGSGALAGATVVVRADDGRVRVRLTGPPGADLGGWRARIAQRLAARGLDVEHVDVT
jgi:hypothetical protein